MTSDRDLRAALEAAQAENIKLQKDSAALRYLLARLETLVIDVKLERDIELTAEEAAREVEKTSLHFSNELKERT
jgi:multidrug efflux pump subunit AcrA (membrane-fusion protein)